MTFDPRQLAGFLYLDPRESTSYIRRMDAGQIAKLNEQFIDHFGAGGRIRIIRAPGRVNLIGEHTDYNEGFVCPMAIEPQVTVACRVRDDGVIRVASTFFPHQIVEFSIRKKIERGEPAWANYIRGIAAGLVHEGVPMNGMDALYTNNLPVGGGLSSSAAIEISTGLALLTLAGQNMDPMRLALLGQQAEHQYALVPCGIMDQMIVTSGRAEQAILFDCRSSEKRYVPLDASEVRIVICNSMVRHELTGGEYGERRMQCEHGVRFFQQESPSIRSLRDVTLQQVEAAKGKLGGVFVKRCRHVVSENARCIEAADAIDRRDYIRAGELMVQSHLSLRDDYEVSVPQLDFLVERAMEVKGIYGARMTGGGFGGCIVALCQPSAVEDLMKALRDSYQAKYKIDPGIFATTATDGASVLE